MGNIARAHAAGYQDVKNAEIKLVAGSDINPDSDHARDIVDKFGIHPNNFCAARCFIGDSSDGISGIKGAGFKTMAKRFPGLLEEEDISVDDIIEASVEQSKSSKVKLFTNIIESQDIPRRNWKLMFLGTNNLSADQINKISGIINTFEPSRNKIEIMRLLLREGVNNFDVDAFYMSVNGTYAG